MDDDPPEDGNEVEIIGEGNPIQLDVESNEMQDDAFSTDNGNASDQNEGLEDIQGIAESNGNHQSEEKEVASSSEVKSVKRCRESDSDEENADSRNVCPICMDKWTNAGDHRLVCLKCGHLFGNSCIVRWLEIGCQAGQRRCPQCNKKASKRDIRTLYVHNLQALDTAEYEKLQEEINVLKQDKTRLEMEIARVNLNNKLHQEELAKALNTVQSLQNSLTSVSKQNSQPLTQKVSISRMVLECTVEISSAGGCRVLAWNSLNHCLYVTSSSSNALFPGFNVRKIKLDEERPQLGAILSLHSKAIRDLAIRPLSNDILLSVSLDKTAKLVDLSNHSVINKFMSNYPLWSCCWDVNNLNRFFVGSQNGLVMQFDSRHPNAPLQQLSFPGDLSPVTSLVSLQYCAGRAMPQGGVLVSKLVSCWALKQNTSGDQFQTQQLPVEGPFTSLCHEAHSDHILISRRPNARNPNTSHMVCQLHQEGETVECNVIHSFSAGATQQLLSRPCFTKVEEEMYVAAYVECQNCINVWNVSSGQIIASVKAHEPVKDICATFLQNKLCFLALSERTLRLYSLA